jgi:hypothetical protein
VATKEARYFGSIEEDELSCCQQYIQVGSEVICEIRRFHRNSCEKGEVKSCIFLLLISMVPV